MAYPGDPSGPPPRGGASFVAGRLTPDDFEQLAAAFRPSWEFDEAPFTGPGSLSPSELHTLGGLGGTHADIRAAAPQTNGVHSHPVPKPTPALAELPDSVMVAPALTPSEVPPPVAALAPTPAPTPFGPPVSVPAPAPAPSRVSSPDRLAQTRIVQRPVPAAIPRAKESTGSFDVGHRSKKPLWIALGAGVVVLAAVGIWSVSSGSSDSSSPPAPTTVATPAPTRPPPDIPPPAETLAAPPPTMAQVPRTVPVSALAQVPMPAQTSAPPPARPAIAPTPPPAPRPVAPTPRPAPRPKAGSATIVHDVPF